MFTLIGIVAVAGGAYMLYKKYSAVITADVSAAKADIVALKADVAALVAKAKAAV